MADNLKGLAGLEIVETKNGMQWLGRDVVSLYRWETDANKRVSTAYPDRVKGRTCC
jgi:hypothetical protein